MRFILAFGLVTCILGATILIAAERGQDRGAKQGNALAQAQPAIQLLPLKVVGTDLQNSENKSVRLHGVNVASMEWSSNGEGHVLKTVKTAILDWHANIVRLPLAQDRWFGKEPGAKDGGKAYRALIKEIVDECAGLKCYIALDLHWSDAGEWGKHIGQHKMPDQNSVAFWKDVAQAYRNHPAVIFDLYNEPYGTAWSVWRDGGKITERNRRTGSQITYQAIGMQALLDKVRSTGAKNVVIVGGLDWAYDLSGILAGGELLDREGNGIIYANHTYPFKGDSVEKWIAKMTAASSKIPIIVSEFGSDSRGPSGAKSEEWVRQVLQALHDHDWSWVAWDLHPRAGPCLVSDWNYTPTPWFGKWVKQALEGTLPPFAPASSSQAPLRAKSRTKMVSGEW